MHAAPVNNHKCFLAQLLLTWFLFWCLFFFVISSCLRTTSPFSEQMLPNSLTSPSQPRTFFHFLCSEDCRPRQPILKRAEKTPPRYKRWKMSAFQCHLISAIGIMSRVCIKSSCCSHTDVCVCCAEAGSLLQSCFLATASFFCSCVAPDMLLD